MTATMNERIEALESRLRDLELDRFYPRMRVDRDDGTVELVSVNDDDPRRREDFPDDSFAEFPEKKIEPKCVGEDDIEVKACGSNVGPGEITRDETGDTATSKLVNQLTVRAELAEDALRKIKIEAANDNVDADVDKILEIAVKALAE